MENKGTFNPDGSYTIGNNTYSAESMRIMMRGCQNDLFDCFPYAFINENGEFICTGTHFRRANVYLCLQNCKTPEDVDCKILEWLSRHAHKHGSYTSEYRNREVQNYIRNGINQYCGTDFSAEDMEVIYTYLGNGVNHDLTLKFVREHFDLNVLLKEGE